MPRLLFKCLAVLWLILVSTCALAVIDVHEFSSEEIRERYESLTEELRCPKCQNQSLAGSDSPVSEDLRREILLLLEDGRSDQEIRDYMRDRYGDFILYNPPAEGKTLLVWVIPAVLFFIGLLVIFFVVRSATRNAAINVPDDLESADDEFINEQAGNH
jgi:cytochrome c-type biogenesis protein CcmH